VSGLIAAMPHPAAVALALAFLALLVLASPVAIAVHPDITGATASPPPDSQIALDIDAKQRQKVARLKVTMSCQVTEEPCAAEFRGKAVARPTRANRKRAAAAGEKKSFKLQPRLLVLLNRERLTQRLKYKDHRKSVRELKRLLKRPAYRKRTKARIEIAASDAAGDSTAEALRVKLRR